MDATKDMFNGVRVENMGHAGQFGQHYLQVLHRLYSALEWRYAEIKGKQGLKREEEILAKLLDQILADQVGHDLPLHHAEEALREFQHVRHDSFTPAKYRKIMKLMGIVEEKTHGYVPHLYGNVLFEFQQL